MSTGPYSDLDQAATLAEIEDALQARRQACVDELLLVLQWTDLHSADPQTQPGAAPITQGGDKLITLGGEGTPAVSEFCFAELAIARQAGIQATRNLAADGLDLRHRLPLLFTQVHDLVVEVWVARKIATMTRTLSRDAAAFVDQAVSESVGLAPGRLLDLAQTTVIEADLEAHRRRVQTDATRTGVWFGWPRPGDLLDGQAGPGYAATAGLTARLGTGQALELDTVIDDLADRLAAHTTDHEQDVTRDQLRADALALLAHPAKALAFLTDDQEISTSPTTLPRRDATIYLHLSESQVATADDIGPMLLEQVTDLLGHRNVTIRPVIDLNTTQTVDSHPHPTAVKTRTLLRTGGDVFPHTTSRTRRLDHDHPTPYDPDGPPAQTGDHNDAPLTRFHHRVKTHQPGWQLQQIGPADYRWTTPHGLIRIVTPHGTYDG